MRVMKKIFILTGYLVYSGSLWAQTPNWQNMDLKTDSVFGISTERTYLELLKGKKPKTVLVAVIDSGIDTLHEDLTHVLWNNPKERSNNKDDDGNGYIDDLHGWNFIGGSNGNIHYDNSELTRIIRRDRDFYDSLSNARVPEQYQKGFQTYRKMRKEFEYQLQLTHDRMDAIEKLRKTLGRMFDKINKANPSIEDFQKYQPVDEDEGDVKNMVVNHLRNNHNLGELQKQLNDFYSFYDQKASYELNIDYDPRSIVGDRYSEAEERSYGNNDVCGPDASHGTHVAGIIGAERNNSLGINGVADNVQIMSIRTVPAGDERDKDVANAIRYAVDNGAKIINMSFGKPFSWNKRIVDEAVKYAMSKDVLIIHAAGNDGKNLDEVGTNFFPNNSYEDGSGKAKAWITVGASAWKDDSTLIATFSNYGVNTVDVFAPGVRIYSTVPGSRYDYNDGTSMAAPVVTGLASLIWGCYPKLTAIQVKEIIINSVIKVNHDVIVRSNNQVKKIPFSQVCSSGGVVNAYQALELAASMK